MQIDSLTLLQNRQGVAASDKGDANDVLRHRLSADTDDAAGGSSRGWGLLPVARVLYQGQWTLAAVVCRTVT